MSRFLTNILCLLITSVNSIGQSEADSLRALIPTAEAHQLPKIYSDLLVYYYRIDLDSSLMYARLELETAKNVGDKQFELEAYGDIGQIYYLKGEAGNSFEALAEGLKKAQEYENNREIGNSYLRLGIVYGMMNKTKDELKMAELALPYFETASDQGGVLACLNSMGVIHRRLEEYDEAINKFELILEIAEKDSNYSLMASSYGNIGICHLNREETLEASGKFGLCLEYARLSNNPPVIAQALDYLSQTSLESGSLEEAKSFLSESININRDLGNKSILAGNYRTFSKILTEDGNFKAALLYNDSSLTYYREQGNLEEIWELTDARAALFEEVGQSDSAVVLYKLATTLKDSAESISKKEEIKNEALYAQIEEQEKELFKVKEENKDLAAENEAESSTNFMLWVVVLISVLGLILLIYLIRKKVISLRKEKAESASKQKELSSMSHQLMEKNVALEKVDKGIKAVKEELEMSGKMEDGKINSDLKNLAKELEAGLNFDDDWKQFKLHFEKVNDGFFQKIESKHPNLTDKDLRVLAYIHLKLDSFEIAEILSISPPSVKKQRHRLRKKMELEAEADIGKYIQGLLS